MAVKTGKEAQRRNGGCEAEYICRVVGGPGAGWWQRVRTREGVRGWVCRQGGGKCRQGRTQRESQESRKERRKQGQGEGCGANKANVCRDRDFGQKSVEEERVVCN